MEFTQEQKEHIKKTIKSQVKKVINELDDVANADFLEDENMEYLGNLIIKKLCK